MNIINGLTGMMGHSRFLEDLWWKYMKGEHGIYVSSVGSIILILYLTLAIGANHILQ